MRWLDAAADLRGQTFRNVVLIKLQMPDAIWVDGRPGWQRLGRRVARGASGIRIVASGRDIDRLTGPVQGHGVATVWDVTQTEGRLPSRGMVGTVRPQDVYAVLARVAADAGFRVERGPLRDAPSGAVTDLQRRRVTVSEELDGSVAVMSLAHQLAHLRMHKLSRNSGCHGLVRLEAESVAYVTLARFGVLPEYQMASSVATLGRRPPVRLVETLGGRVVAAAGRLIDSTERYLPAPQILRGAARSEPISFDTQDRELDRGL
ncbi:hypothetical protein [Kribbella sp. VKM Ac-2566]|uniref:hypothetical protein n=1 Tax=Kribbella sp. VKM Ac-2566 TaxID=2512218 RepID=UPI0010638CDB|nr:hypothetical protein [Kribbella sp. VKM Ac-2566]